MSKKVKLSYRILGKIGLLLVVIGFFMPIKATYKNGFEFAKYLNNFNNTFSAILVYVLFAAAIAGVVVGVLLYLKNKIKVSVDWICVLACIGSGFIVFLTELEGGLKLKTGAYIILIGWIIALVAQIISHVNRES